MKSPFKIFQRDVTHSIMILSIAEDCTFEYVTDHLIIDLIKLMVLLNSISKTLQK
jgi:hypothetical protein